jgi:hypothetical protein
MLSMTYPLNFHFGNVEEKLLVIETQPKTIAKVFKSSLHCISHSLLLGFVDSSTSESHSIGLAPSGVLIFVSLDPADPYTRHTSRVVPSFNTTRTTDETPTLNLVLAESASI